MHVRSYFRGFEYYLYIASQQKCIHTNGNVASHWVPSPQEGLPVAGSFQPPMELYFSPGGHRLKVPRPWKILFHSIATRSGYPGKTFCLKFFTRTGKLGEKTALNGESDLVARTSSHAFIAGWKTALNGETRVGRRLLKNSGSRPAVWT